MDGEDRVELLLSDGKKETLLFVVISKMRAVLVLRVGQEVIYDAGGSEEADAYFKDMKTIKEVCEIIANRVQLYLDEG